MIRLKPILRPLTLALAMLGVGVLFGCDNSDALSKRAQVTCAAVRSAQELVISGRFFDRVNKKYVSKEVKVRRREDIQSVGDMLADAVRGARVQRFRHGEIFATKLVVSISAYTDSKRIAQAKVVGASYLIFDESAACEVDINVTDVLDKLTSVKDHGSSL